MRYRALQAGQNVSDKKFLILETPAKLASAHRLREKVKIRLHIIDEDLEELR